MYDPAGADTGREWIEVYNDTSELVSLSTWKLFEAGVNHGITSVRGDGVVSPGEYAVVVSDGMSSIAGYSEYIGDVYDSSFSLANTGESFSFKTPSGSYVAQVSYVGGMIAAGDETSLHWIGGLWQARYPNIGMSPDLAQFASSTSSQNTTAQQTTGGGSSGAESTIRNSVSGDTGNTQIRPVYSMSVQTWPSQPVSNGEFVIKPKVLRTFKGETLELTQGIVRITTGDGREFVQSSTHPLSFRYDRAGTYRLIIEFSQSSLDVEPLAQYSVDFQVIEPAVRIGKNGYAITLTNESESEINLSGYYIIGGDRKIILSRGTVILPTATISVGDSARILSGNPEFLELVMPDGTTKVSRREFIPAVVRSVSLAPSVREVNDTASVVYAAAVKTESHTKLLLPSVRDSSLVVDVGTQAVDSFDQDILTTSGLDQVQGLGDAQGSGVNQEMLYGDYVAESPNRVILIVGAICALATLSIVFRFVLRGVSFESEGVEHRTLLPGNRPTANPHSHLGTAGEYVIIDR
jgi:hypothetical protein